MHTGLSNWCMVRRRAAPCRRSQALVVRDRRGAVVFAPREDPTTAAAFPVGYAVVAHLQLHEDP
eukprot:8017791-Heterocapsa_arctica.AAC.1